jgi:hypothetical protein
MMICSLLHQVERRGNCVRALGAWALGVGALGVGRWARGRAAPGALAGDEAVLLRLRSGILKSSSCTLQ